MAITHNSKVSDNEPDWGSVDKTRLPRNAFADQGEADQKSTWAYPHHWVENGQLGENGVYESGDMYLHQGGLNAAWAAAQGARTGDQASQEVIDHLQAHRRALGLDKGGGDRMMSMVALLHATGDKGEADVKVLFDTGASHSFVLRSVAEKLTTIVKLPRPYLITLGDGSKIAIVDVAVLHIAAAGQDVIDTFLVLDKSVEDIILGESSMRKFALKIDFERGAVYSVLRNGSKEGEMKDFLKKVFARLGIQASEETPEDKAIELIAAKAQPADVKLVASKGILQVLELTESATEDQVKGKILALKHPGNTVSREEHEALLARMHAQEIDSAVSDAIAAGKLTPAEKEWGRKMAEENLATFNAFIANRPKVVPVGTKLPDKKETPGAVKIDDVQAEVNKQLGVTQETFAKYNATVN